MDETESDKSLEKELDLSLGNLSEESTLKNLVNTNSNHKEDKNNTNNSTIENTITITNPDNVIAISGNTNINLNESKNEESTTLISNYRGYFNKRSASLRMKNETFNRLQSSSEIPNKNKFRLSSPIEEYKMLQQVSEQTAKGGIEILSKSSSSDHLGDSDIENMSLNGTPRNDQIDYKNVLENPNLLYKNKDESHIQSMELIENKNPVVTAQGNSDNQTIINNNYSININLSGSKESDIIRRFSHNTRNVNKEGSLNKKNVRFSGLLVKKLDLETISNSETYNNNNSERKNTTKSIEDLSNDPASSNKVDDIKSRIKRSIIDTLYTETNEFQCESENDLPDKKSIDSVDSESDYLSEQADEIIEFNEDYDGSFYKEMYIATERQYIKNKEMNEDRIKEVASSVIFNILVQKIKNLKTYSYVKIETSRKQEKEEKQYRPVLKNCFKIYYTKTKDILRTYFKKFSKLDNCKNLIQILGIENFTSNMSPVDESNMLEKLYSNLTKKLGKDKIINTTSETGNESNKNIENTSDTKEVVKNNNNNLTTKPRPPPMPFGNKGSQQESNINSENNQTPVPSNFSKPVPPRMPRLPINSNSEESQSNQSVTNSKLPIPPRLPHAPRLPVANSQESNENKIVDEGRKLPVPPRLPVAPRLPNAPTMPGAPRLPNAPTMPGAPRLPGAPTMPGAPRLPGGPRLPRLQNTNEQVPSQPQYIAPKPPKDSNVRKLFWNPINKNKISNTFWSSYNFGTSKIDYESLCKYFCEPKKKEISNDETKNEEKKVDPGPTTIKLLEDKKIMNLSIVLPKLTLKIDELKYAVENFKEDILTESLIEIINVFIPNSEELEKLQTYTGDLKLISEGERFCIGLLSVDKISAKLNWVTYKRELSIDSEEVIKQLKKLKEAITSIRTSQNFLNVFKMILDIGNYLNSDTPKGNALGILVNSINLLDSTRGYGEVKYTLLEFLVINIKSMDPSLITFYKDFAYLDEVLDFDEADIEKKIKNIENGIKKIQKEKDDLKKENKDSNLMFMTYLSDLELIACGRLDKILTLQDAYTKELKDTQTFFGEDPKTFKLNEFLKNFNTFTENYKKAALKISADEAKKLKQQIKEEKNKKMETNKEKKDKDLEKIRKTVVRKTKARKTANKNNLNFDKEKLREILKNESTSTTNEKPNHHQDRLSDSNYVSRLNEKLCSKEELADSKHSRSPLIGGSKKIVHLEEEKSRKTKLRMSKARITKFKSKNEEMDDDIGDDFDDFIKINKPMKINKLSNIEGVNKSKFY